VVAGAQQDAVLAAQSGVHFPALGHHWEPAEQEDRPNPQMQYWSVQQPSETKVRSGRSAQRVSQS